MKVVRLRTVPLARWWAATRIAGVRIGSSVSRADGFSFALALALAARRRSSGSWAGRKRCCMLRREEACRRTAVGRSQRLRRSPRESGLGMAARGARSGRGSLGGAGLNLFFDLCYRRRSALASRLRSGMRNLNGSMVARRASSMGRERGLDPRHWRAGSCSGPASCPPFPP
jgi:hypothetical protein